MKLSTYPEIKTFVLQGKGNALSISIELFPLTQREAKNQRGVFEIETLILKDFSYFESQGLKVSVQSQG